MMPLHQISVTPIEKSDKAHQVDTKIMRRDSKEKYHVATQTPLSLAERCSSRASTLSYTRDFCRICHCEGDSDVPLISPCYCSGSLRYVHQACLQQWIKSSNIKCCELCKFTFVMQTKTKPFGMWERLDMAASERRKLLCSVTFHVVALTCVVWSLYVLIERTTEEVSSGVLGWPFWTKLIVVAIGVTGCVVFMYVQCKVYAQLCRRWRAYNRVIFVQNVPEKIPVVGLERDPEREDVTAPPPVVSDAGGGASGAEDGVDWLALEGGGANCSERRESAERVTHVTIELNGGLSSVVTLPPIGQCAKSSAVTSVTDTSPLDSAPLTSLLRSPTSADDVISSGNDVTPSSNASEPALAADPPRQSSESTKYPVDDGVG